MGVIPFIKPKEQFLTLGNLLHRKMSILCFVKLIIYTESITSKLKYHDQFFSCQKIHAPFKRTRKCKSKQ